MSKTRKIKRVFKSKPTIEGAGVHLKRAFGFSEVPLFDPFLLLDDFRSDTPAHFLKGFPWHPHRGNRDDHVRPARGRANTATAWETRASSAPATCSG